MKRKSNIRIVAVANITKNPDALFAIADNTWKKYVPKKSKKADGDGCRTEVKN